ncbi:UDP-N-acetylglucosamine 2-epimerase (hydrolyzing) [Candidatus Peregrinibacteria bacterium]|nr:UDP-N-acetylglucosamine 2-epimerase (hydrolyzing) [Candidatus Peregrinibacteria bacterium]
MRKIAVITGIRADYGILYPILKEIENRKNASLQLIVAGAHLSHEFGYTIGEIEKDGFKIAAKVDMLLSDDTGARMARSLGVGILEFAQVFEMIEPDITIVLGDREEMLAAAIASLCINIPVAHIHGGEVGTGGHIDESIRHALTKFSHLHFAATQKSAQRIMKLGEEKWRVHYVGAPFIDNIALNKITQPSMLIKKYNLDLKQPLIVVVQHPLAIDAANSRKQMEETMKAVAFFKLPTLVVYPNVDAGGKDIIDVIKKYEKYSYITAYKNLPSADYLGLLKVASVLVGNSSSAILEAPTFHLPAVNIGSRQLGREMAKNIISVPYDEKAIQKAIKKALFDKKFQSVVKECKSAYEASNVSKKIVDILSAIDIDDTLLHKIMTF